MANIPHDHIKNNVDEMRLGFFEFIAMNNPLKKFFQKYVEFSLFKTMLDKHYISLENKIILDGGCGSGYSTKLIAEEFKPAALFAFDYMPEQIALAKRWDIGVEFSTGDLTDIQLDNNLCNAVFIFGVIHHIPHWQKALAEIRRVLKPGGCLLLEEPKVRFSWQELESGLGALHFHILDTRQYLFNFFHCYLCIAR